MKRISAASTDELRNILAGFQGEFLFRGQTSHYEKDGMPSVVTSFDRQGCIPSEMVKWIRYARGVLEAYIGEKADTLPFWQALLQHYGWRSFFVDCSTSAAVGAWFASHTYSDNTMFELCEDFEERAVVLKKRMASYEFTEGEGNLYVLDKALSETLVGAVDLAALKIEGAHPRTEAQSAWLVGPLSNTNLPAECFAAHITASRAVLRDYAAQEGLVTTEDLFPSRKDDPLLRALLSLPWKKIENQGKDIGLLFFCRALDLPEYHESFVKISAEGTAFFQGAKVAQRGSIDGIPYSGTTVPMPEIVIFGSADEAPLRFPEIEKLLAEHRSVAFEIDELIQHPTMRGRTLYQKGIAAIAHEPTLVQVSELLVEHPGLDLTRAGINPGWFYRIGGDGLWRREAHSEECDCGHEKTHLRHISAMHIIEYHLANPDSLG